MPAKDGTPRAGNWKKRQRTKSPRRALCWEQSRLQHALSRLIENLGPVHALLLRFLEQPTELRWGSACSGTESPAWVFSFFKYFGYMSFKHVYGAEWVAAKREWNPAQACPRNLFKDVFDLTRRLAFCYASQECADPKKACHEKPTDLFIDGFSCKTVSALSNDAEARRRSIGDYFGSTLMTFWGCVLVPQNTRPFAFVVNKR